MGIFTRNELLVRQVESNLSHLSTHILTFVGPLVGAGVGETVGVLVGFFDVR